MLAESVTPSVPFVVARAAGTGADHAEPIVDFQPADLGAAYRQCWHCEIAGGLGSDSQMYRRVSGSGAGNGFQRSSEPAPADRLV